ncbi:MAG: tetratricopeptide repeat protein [Terriglobales bacterium]
MQLAGRNLEGPSALAQLFEKRGVMEALVCAVTFLAYLSTLSFGFIYDDKPVIVDNPVIRSWDFLTHYLLPQASANFAQPAGGSFYRPISVLWLRLNYVIFGLNPAGWHFALLAGHVFMTYLVFVVVGKLSRRSTASLAAILFGLHPVHTENVAWLSSVNDLLMSVFVLASFLAYLKFREGRKSTLWMAASLVLFLAALLSKEPAAVFPFLIFVFALIFARPRPAGNSTPAWASFKDGLKGGLVSIPYFIVLAIFLAVRKSMLHGEAQSLTTLSWSTMLLTAPSILWFDLKHLLFPISSSEFYSLAYVTAPGFENFLLPMLFLAAAALAVAYCISTLLDPRLAVFASGFALATILPTLYLRAIAPGNFVHDRFLYLPSVGIVILIALVVESIATLKPLPGQDTGMKVKWALVAILCIAAFVGTLIHELPWASNLLLFQNAMKYAPNNPIVQVNLANEFANLGHYDRALPLYWSALKSDPSSWLSNYNLGYACYRTGRFPEAADYLQRAIQIDDKDPDQFIYLARTQMEQGKLTLAAQNAERALQRGPLSPGFHFVLAKILEASGERERAIAEYQAEVAAHPDNTLARGELLRLQSVQ